MAEHMVTLWLEGDDDPADIDWDETLPGYTITGKKIRTYPWSDVHHEITWWITRQMTLKEWGRLDSLESEALYEVVGDNFMGTAGPIPLEVGEEEKE